MNENPVLLRYVQKTEKFFSMHILLVDDDEDDQNLFKGAARELDPDIVCVSVSDGTEALAYLQDESGRIPDFIFLDLRMPGLSGEECLIEIKKIPRVSKIPVIVYTTSRDVEESRRLKKIGAAHFASKPVLPEEVFYMVSFVLGENW